MNRSTVIHVSGSPGSGKTYIGNLLEREYPNYIKHIDTDTLPRDSSARDSKILKIIEEYGNSKIILFCGIIYIEDNAGYKIKNKNCSKFKWAVMPKIKNYFIKILPEKLLEQYYTRTVMWYESKSGKDKEEFWHNIAICNDIIFSSPDMLIRNKRDSNWHSDNGYLIISQSDIINVIVKYINSIKKIPCQIYS